MNNLPWHPIVVHFPLVMAFLVPLVTVIVFAGRSRGPLRLRSWWVAVIAGAMLAVGSVTALKTGQNEEERVEEVVSNSPLHEHEEAAEGFMWGSIVLLALLLPLPFLRTGRLERAAAVVALAGGVTVGALAIRVGHSGGTLVYEHGAATAYASSGGAVRSSPVGSRRDYDDDERDEHR